MFNFISSQEQVKIESVLNDIETLQLTRAFAFVSEGIVITDPTQADNPIIYVNPAFTQMTGYPAEEAVGQNCRFLQGSGTDRHSLDQIRTAITQCRDVTVTLLNYRKNGESFWNELNISPIFDDDGSLLYFVGIQTDITERKQAELALQNQSRLSKLQATVGVALGEGGALQSSLQQCTQAVEDCLGLTQVSLWTLNPHRQTLELQAQGEDHERREQDLFTQPALSLQETWLGEVVAAKEPTQLRMTDCDLEGGFQVKSTFLAGYPLQVEGRVLGVIALGGDQPLLEAEQEVMSWIASAIALAIDRSWTKEELALRREGILFELASQIRNSLDLDTILGTAVAEIRNLLAVDLCQYVWCWSHPTLPSLAVSHQAGDEGLAVWLEQTDPERLIPLAREILGLRMLRVDNIQSAFRIDSESLELLQDVGIKSQLLLPLQTRSGQRGAIICSHRSAHPWSDNEVKLLQAIVDQLAIAIDQAELFAQTKAAALAAQTQAKQLQITIKELKDAESRLIQSEKMSSLGQMVAGIAHEINNPVNFITGNLTHTSDYVQDLLDLIDLYQNQFSDPNQEITEFCEEIDLEFLLEDLPKTLGSMRMGADRIRKIVLSLRNFSRLDEAETKPVDIHEGIDSTLLILHSRLKAKGTQPEITVLKNYGDLPEVECYAGQLNQVFMNLIGNAIDALSDQDNPQITITTSIEQDAPNGLDAPAVLIRIADNGSGMPETVRKRIFDPFFTTKPPGRGTGLGLSISYQIVEKHKGILECESEVDQGTTFKIYLPIRNG